MSQPPPPPPSTDPDDLQFDTADPGEAAEQPTGDVACSACGNPIPDQYYAAGDKVVCPGCRDAYIASRTGGSRIARLLKALVFGVVAGLGGALIWYAVRRFTGYEVGLIAIVVGLMVGGAVRAGSSGRGGIGYQILAVLLTYFSICANYMPDIFMALRDEFRQEQFADATTQPSASTTASTTAPASAPASLDDVEAAPAAMSEDAGNDEPTAGEKALGLAILVVFMFAISLAAPFLGGAGNIIGLLIIAFALWEAWKINKRQEANLTGPYALSAGPPPAAAQPGGM